MLAARPVDSSTTAQGKKRAADAAELVVSGARAKRRCQGQDATKESASQRLAAGRTLGNLRDLIRTDLFHHQVASAVFHAGSFARVGSRDVFVLGTFRRRGDAMADTVPVDAAVSSGLRTCRLNCVQTWPQQDLKAPAFAYLAVQSPVPRNRQLLHFRKHEPDSCPPHDAVERLLAASAAWRLSGRQFAAATDAMSLRLRCRWALRRSSPRPARSMCGPPKRRVRGTPCRPGATAGWSALCSTCPCPRHSRRARTGAIPAGTRWRWLARPRHRRRR